MTGYWLILPILTPATLHGNTADTAAVSSAISSIGTAVVVRASL